MSIKKVFSNTLCFDYSTRFPSNVQRRNVWLANMHPGAVLEKIHGGGRVRSRAAE